MTKKNGFSFPFWDVFFSRREQFFLFLLVLGGLVLRIINAIDTPFWRDEIYIFYVARTNTLWQLVTQQHWDTAHPPLYSVFLHFWQMISIHPFWLRIPSIITSFFLLYLIPILAVKIAKNNKRLPFVLLFLFAISNTQISLNMVARPYPFVSLISVIALIHLLDLYSLSPLSLKKTLPFILVNALGFYVDYSFVWLFFTYMFVLTVQFFRDAQKRTTIIILVQSLFITGIILIPAFIMLFSRLPQSFKLESQTRIKFEASPTTNTLQGSPLSLSLFRDKKSYLTVDTPSHTLMKKDGEWLDPLLEGTPHLGFDIPPLSGILVNQLSYCASTSPHPCDTYKDFLPQLDKSKIKSIVAFRIGPSVFLFNLHPKEWRSYLFPVSTDKSPARHTIQTSFFVVGRNAQIVFASSHEGIVEFMDKKRLAAVIKMESRNLFYEALLSDPKKNLEVRFFESSSFIDKFGSDLLFFAGLPSYTNDIFAWISCVFLAMSIGTVVYGLKEQRSIVPILIFALLAVPIVASFILSATVAPIFVARNLYLSSLGYLLGISLLITHLLIRKSHLKGVALSLLAVFALFLFMRYPFLHYVDPPYGVDRMVHTILDGDTQKKKIVVIDNPSHYEPLLYHELLMTKYRGIPIAVTTKDSFKKILNTLTIDDMQKKHYEYYFIRFNQDINNFGEIASLLDCKIDKIKMTYAFFAHCHH